jgi:hypothetical protein
MESVQYVQRSYSKYFHRCMNNSHLPRFQDKVAVYCVPILFDSHLQHVHLMVHCSVLMDNVANSYIHSTHAGRLIPRPNPTVGTKRL